jgi:hypothetical protein
MNDLLNKIVDDDMAMSAARDPLRQLDEIVSRLNDVADIIDKEGSYNGAHYLRATSRRCFHAINALRNRPADSIAAAERKVIEAAEAAWSLVSAFQELQHARIRAAQGDK